MNSAPIIAFPAFLLSVEVLHDRGLRIVLEEKTGRGLPEDDPLGVGMIGSEIVRDGSDRSYELTWDVVACFAVRGDPFPKGQTLRVTITEVAGDSAFLGWVRSQSHAEPDYLAAMAGDFEPDPSRRLRHWVIVCNEATFDVAALDPPRVWPIVSSIGKGPLMH